MENDEDRNELLTQIGPVLAVTPGFYTFLDEEGASCEFTDTLDSTRTPNLSRWREQTGDDGEADESRDRHAVSLKYGHDVARSATRWVGGTPRGGAGRASVGRRWMGWVMLEPVWPKTRRGKNTSSSFPVFENEVYRIQFRRYRPRVIRPRCVSVGSKVAFDPSSVESPSSLIRSDIVIYGL